MEKERVENVISDLSALLSSFNCLWIAAGMMVQPYMGLEGDFCCRCSIAEPAEPPQNPTSIPLPISRKICRTKVLKGYSGLFLLICQSSCVQHDVKLKFRCYKDVKSCPHVKSILSLLLCSQSHLMSCSLADTLVECGDLLAGFSTIIVIHHTEFETQAVFDRTQNQGRDLPQLRQGL